MKLLALDTSTTIGSVAIIEDQGKLLGEQIIQSQHSHSVHLLPAISNLLKQCGLDLSDMDCFAATIGPGSFTGLRVGAAVINTINWLRGKKKLIFPKYR